MRSTTRLHSKRTIKAHVLSFGRKQSLLSSIACSDDQISVLAFSKNYSDEGISLISDSRTTYINDEMSRKIMVQDKT